MRFGLVIDIITAQLGLIRTLRGLTPEFGSFDDEQFDELRFERRLASNPSLAFAECWYWIRKLQARFFAGDYACGHRGRVEGATAAVDVAIAFRNGGISLLWCACPGGVLRFRVRRASASSISRLWPPITGSSQIWAENCPENFENRAALVGAEIARIEGRELDASASTNRPSARPAPTALFTTRRSPTNWPRASTRRVASRRSRDVYLRDARYGYLRWGADGKVRQLEQLHPHLRDAPVHCISHRTIGAPVEQLDVGTVLKVSQAVSGEIVLDKLIETLLRIAIEHAGAERGLLILFPGDEPRIEAEATTGRGQVEVTLRQTAVSPAELPESVLHYVIRTRESVILDDALAQNPFSADEYIRQKHARSVLCLPLVKQAKLIGVLYLENNLASHVFTPARISVLELLASQAAISLENARLYSDLQEREARIRRLVDSNIIGIFIWDLRGPDHRSQRGLSRHRRDTAGKTSSRVGCAGRS